MALSFFCLNYPLVCFLLFKRYAFEVVQKFGCISDPKGYVLGRFQVKGKTPGRPCGGAWAEGAVRQFTYTIAVYADMENNKN